MVIYAEYLFAENFMTGILILIMTGRACSFHIKKRNIALGGALCGLFSFTIGIEQMAAYLSIAMKLIFSAVVILVVYFPKTKQAFGKLLLFFYIISFALGGITIGFMYFLGTPGMTNNSFIYLEGITYVNIMVGCIVAYWMLDLIVKNIKERILGTAQKNYRVEIQIGENHILAKGMVDTGNYLTEPISGYPVFIVSKSVGDRLLNKTSTETAGKGMDMGRDFNIEDKMAQRMRAIPFESVGEKKGMLVGIKPDKIILGDETGERTLHNIYLAINNCEFFRETHGNNYSILLHRDVLDRGVNEHDTE
ncbi:MAG: sigma-E processing peptidase SpoIIGA [Anaerovorax sp.]